MAGLSAPLLTITDENGSSLIANGLSTSGGSVSTLFSMISGVTLTNTAAETSLIGFGIGSTTLPANFWAVGKEITMSLRGFCPVSAGATSTTFRVKLNGVTFASVAATSAAAPGDAWQIDFLLGCRSTGPTGTVIGQGACVLYGAGPEQGLPMTVVKVIDTTAVGILDITGQPNVPSVADAFTSTNCLILSF